MSLCSVGKGYTVLVVILCYRQITGHVENWRLILQINSWSAQEVLIYCKMELLGECLRNLAYISIPLAICMQAMSGALMQYYMRLFFSNMHQRCTFLSSVEVNIDSYDINPKIMILTDLHEAEVNFIIWGNKYRYWKKLCIDNNFAF